MKVLIWVGYTNFYANRCLSAVCDHEIGFAIIGEYGSFVALEKTDLKKMREMALDEMEYVISGMPDFRDMTLSGGEQGGIVIMGRAAWQPVPAEKVTIKDGEIAFHCAFAAREILFESCMDGMVYRALLPPGTDITDTDLTGWGDEN